MTDQERALDIQIRLPDNKKHLKKELKRMAKKNHLTLTQLITLIFEWWLEEVGKGTEFSIKIK